MKKKKYRFILPVVLLLLLPAAVLLQKLAAGNPQTVESLYSRGIYRAVSGFFSAYYNLFPFSCAEIILYAVICFAVFLFVVTVIKIVRRRGILRLLLAVCCIATAGYFLFVVLWGLNYCREPLEKNLHYKTGSPTVRELCSVLENETEAINAICPKIAYDKNGCSHYPGGFAKISAGVNDGYTALVQKSALDQQLFSGAKACPKGILASKWMSYTNIEGIFVPFTFEPNVDDDLPNFVLPFDAAHESAHLKGFAREQEANFVAYLADTANSDVYFQYSAHMEAYIYLSDALYASDSASFKKIAARLDKRAVGDIIFYNDYVAAHKTKATDISNKVNDSYLKSQGQRGVVSYDMFVTLLCDRWRTAARP